MNIGKYEISQRTLRGLASKLSTHPNQIVKDDLASSPVSMDNEGSFGLYSTLVPGDANYTVGRLIAQQSYQKQFASVPKGISDTLKSYAYTLNKDRFTKAMIQVSEDSDVLLGSKIIYAGNLIKSFPDGYQFIEKDIQSLDKRILDRSNLPEVAEIANWRDRKEMKRRGNDAVRYGIGMVKESAKNAYNQVTTNGGKTTPKHFEIAGIEMRTFENKVVEGVDSFFKSLELVKF